MKVLLCLEERAHVPTYETNRGRYIVGDWEKGTDYIAVPFGEMPMPSYCAGILEPLHIPTTMCSWWAPVDVEVRRGALG